MLSSKSTLRIISWEMKVIAILAVIFFFFYSYLAMAGFNKFTSPDETANYFFTLNFSKNFKIAEYEPLNLKTEGIIHPRSMVVKEGFILPKSFLGLPIIYGFWGRIFSSKIILFLTPLLSSITVFFFFGLIKKIFGRKIAFISSLFLFIHPTFFFYTEKAMWHNLVFLDFLIIALYFFYQIFQRARLRDYLFFGLFLGLSLMVRTSEVIWIGLIIFLILLFNRQKIKIAYLTIFILLILVLFIPIFYFNNSLYGGPLTFGYSQVIADSTTATATQTLGFWKNLSRLLLPFGFHPERFLANFYHYFLSLLFFLSVPFILGLIIFLKKLYQRNIPPEQIIYFGAIIFIGLWLMIFYGSFEFYEYIDKSAIIFGSSYLRYWLPLFILGLPFLGLFLLEFKRQFLTKKSSLFLVVIASLLVFLSSHFIFNEPLYGLVKTKKEDLEVYQAKAKKILSLTEDYSVILAGRQDKIFFPERKVIGYDYISSSIVNQLSQLSASIPVYYVGPEGEEIWQINGLLAKRGFRFEEIDSFSSSENLYQLKEIE